MDLLSAIYQATRQRHGAFTLEQLADELASNGHKATAAAIEQTLLGKMHRSARYIGNDLWRLTWQPDYEADPRGTETDVEAEAEDEGLTSAPVSTESFFE